MKPIDLLIELRQDLISAISGVKDSDGIYSWDTTTPNSTTKFKLTELLNHHLHVAKSVGLFLITRVCSCSLPSHNKYYMQPAIPGLDRYGASTNIWTGIQLYQGERIMVCPCAAGRGKVKVHVIDELVIRGTKDKRRHEALALALSDVQEAIDNCGDRKTRSSIREYLLRALVTVNDNIVPQSVVECISARAQAVNDRQV